MSENLIFEIFVPWRPFTQNALHIFSCSNLDANIYTTNQDIEKASHTSVD